jgi:hypothetical protein
MASPSARATSRARASIRRGDPYKEARPGPAEVSVLPLWDRAWYAPSSPSLVSAPRFHSPLLAPSHVLARIDVFPRYLLEHYPVRSMFSASD